MDGDVGSLFSRQPEMMRQCLAAARGKVGLFLVAIAGAIEGGCSR